MTGKSNIYFKVGMAPIHEPFTFQQDGQNITVTDGYMFTLKLYEDGNFRYSTNWHVTPEQAKHPDFKKHTQLMINQHREYLQKHFNMFRTPGKIISLS